MPKLFLKSFLLNIIYTLIFILSRRMNLKLFYKFLIIKFKCYFDRSQNTYYSNRILNKNIDKVPAELHTS